MIDKFLNRVLLALDHAELEVKYAGMGFTASEAERLINISNQVRMEAQNDTEAGFIKLALEQKETDHNGGSVLRAGNWETICKDLGSAERGV